MQQSHPAALPDITGITAEWLTAALGGNGRTVSALKHCAIGHGQGFASCIYRIYVEYTPGKTGPASLIVKLPTQNPALQKAMTAQVMYRETEFYRNMASASGQYTPAVYYANCDKMRGSYTILMEDLGAVPAGYEASNAESEAAMRAIAKLHARYWHAADLDDAWLTPLVQTDIDLQGLVAAALDDARANGFGDAYVSRTIRVLQSILHLVLEEGPPPSIARSITHGDFHRNNVQLQHDGRLLIFDWQMIEAGNPLRDVAYWMLVSLTVQQRRKQQRALLRMYYDELCRAGVQGYSFKALQRDFGAGMLENIIKTYCIPALVDADQSLISLLRDRVECAAKDLRALPLAYLLKVTYRCRSAWRRIARAAG